MGRISSKQIYDRAEVMQEDGLDIGIDGAYGGSKVVNAQGSKELSSGYDEARHVMLFLDGVSEGATQMQKIQELGRIAHASALLKVLGFTVEVKEVSKFWNGAAYDVTITMASLPDTETCPNSLANVHGVGVAEFLEAALREFLKARTVSQKQGAFARLRGWQVQRIEAKATS